MGKSIGVIGRMAQMEYQQPFQVVVSDSSAQKTVTTTTRETDTLDDLKKAIAEKTSSKSSQLTLSSNGKPLTNDKATLKDLEIQNGTNLTSNVQMRGGCGVSVVLHGLLVVTLFFSVIVDECPPNHGQLAANQLA